MSKPILLIRIPQESTLPQDIYEALEKKLRDYHVLIMKDSKAERLEMECHNAPHAASEFKELKRIVLEHLEGQ